MDPEVGLPSLPDGCVAAVITDPPYGNATDYASYNDTNSHLAEMVDKVLPELLRVALRALITCGNGNTHLYPKPRWTLCWADPAGQGRGPWGFTSWQPILAYGTDPYLANGLGCRSDTIIKRFLKDKSIDHPCPKPIEFMRWLVTRGSMPGDIILDPFLGSGTTAVAAIQTGRRFIGYEIDEGYCEIAEKRIAEAKAQPRLQLDEQREPQPETVAMEM